MTNSIETDSLIPVWPQSLRPLHRRRMPLTKTNLKLACLISTTIGVRFAKISDPVSERRSPVFQHLMNCRASTFFELLPLGGKGVERSERRFETSPRSG